MLHTAKPLNFRINFFPHPEPAGIWETMEFVRDQLPLCGQNGPVTGMKIVKKNPWQLWLNGQKGTHDRSTFWSGGTGSVTKNDNLKFYLTPPPKARAWMVQQFYAQNCWMLKHITPRAPFSESALQGNEVGQRQEEQITKTREKWRN